MPVPLRLHEVWFNGGTPVDVGGADIVVLVGPNNSGKSRTLHEIWYLASQHSPPLDRSQLFAVDSFSTTRAMAADELVQWLDSNRTLLTAPIGASRSVRALGSGDFVLANAPGYWTSDQHFGELAPQLFRLIGPGDGRGMLGSPGRLGPRQSPDHAIQALLRDAALRSAFESAFRAAFRQNLILDAWFTNTQLRLSADEIQSDFTHASDDGLPSDDLADRLARLPLIDTQSDGVRAFAGLLLTLIAVHHPILLLDEPETFLHPPQARLMGEYLGRLRGDGQLVIATHSLDILLGLLEQREAKVLVVRLSRQSGRTNAETVDPEMLRQLWRDPLLRFSRALDGLFHEAVIVCEGDTDSQFYSAVSYHLASIDRSPGPVDGKQNEIAPHPGATERAFSTNPFDVMFSYAGGKQRVPMITAALAGVHVPVRCIVDFDVLNDGQNMRKLVESLGQDYPAELEQLRRTVDAGIRGHQKTITLQHARVAVAEALVGPDNDAVGSATIAAVDAAVRPASGWAAAKRNGRASVPSGDPTMALDQLLAALKERSVYVVPSGAVESWVKAAPHSGPRWVVHVIENDMIG